ncbi:type I CRISPR-associated protein Cas7 [Oleisolibacter albus]|uniref:type I CRISPR-associated protein Cas7 n=1 Tax=Oleisolibacter albus TaxID=2171757 RepID=UPI000DF47FDC|nr:type I CRISPR-associated protein Cas7 [Oleisolibacter albus]
MVDFNRGTGLLIIEARCSNPNGDPDQESDPRTFAADRRGLISPVSFKRKLRDIVEDHEGPVWQKAASTPRLIGTAQKHKILESRGRNREEIGRLDASTFQHEYWDARVFGNTFLESMKDSKKTSRAHFINTGVVQFGPGVSIAAIDVERLTMTNKAGVEEDKDRGMAPLGWRVVRHGLYAMPFFVNPSAARKTGCSASDIDLLKFLIPHAYRATASAVRPFVDIRHAWYAEHKDPLGSCPDYLIIEAMTPIKKDGDKETPSNSIDDYQIPVDLPGEISGRLGSFEDLCLKDWG